MPRALLYTHPGCIGSTLGPDALTAGKHKPPEECHVMSSHALIHQPALSSRKFSCPAFNLVPAVMIDPSRAVLVLRAAFLPSPDVVAFVFEKRK